MNGDSIHLCPPANSLLESGFPMRLPGVWQFPQATTPFMRYFPRSSSVSADTAPPKTKATKISDKPKFSPSRNSSWIQAPAPESGGWARFLANQSLGRINHWVRASHIKESPCYFLEVSFCKMAAGKMAALSKSTGKKNSAQITI